MIRKENQKIDSLLSRFYREEANNMQIPDRERCWQDFQQLLEKGEQERAGISIPAARAEKKDSFYQFVRRYRNLTAVAAACFLVVMLLGGMPPVQTLRQVLTGSLSQTGADRAKLMGIEDGTEDELLILEQDGLPEEQAARGDAPTPEPPGAEGFGIMQQEVMETAPLSEEEALRQQSIPPGAGERELLPQVTVSDETQKLTFDTLEHYNSSLQENREMAPGKLFYLAVPPEGYRFSRGTITKTDTSLSELRQEFTSPDGARLIVQQSFLVDITIMESEPGEKKPEAHDGPEYHFFTQNGSNIIQWIRDDSMIIVNATLDEDDLLYISDHLVTLD